MPTQGISKEEIRRRAELRAQQAEQRKLDAARALEDRQAARNAELAKTERLRALRIAKAAEAAEAEASAENRRPAVKTRRKKRAGVQS